MKTEIKLIEIRDRATFIPAIAVKVQPGGEDKGEDWLLRAGGWGPGGGVYLMRMVGGQCFYDPYDWNDRTMSTAHIHIDTNFDEIKSGEVVDVEYLLGEKSEPSKSERGSL